MLLLVGGQVPEPPIPGLCTTASCADGGVAAGDEEREGWGDDRGGGPAMPGPDETAAGAGDVIAWGEEGAAGRRDGIA